MRIVEKKEVQYYKTKDGRCPYFDWLNGVDAKTQAILSARVLRLESGNVGCVGNLGDGVHELKIEFGPGLRIYFGNAHGRLVIIWPEGPNGPRMRILLRRSFFGKNGTQGLQPKH